MAYNEIRLGDYIQEYDEINTNHEFKNIDDLQGINSNKYFQECKSNKNDINLFRYRICRKGMFSYNRATSRNGEKISIAYRTGPDCLVSPSYYCFFITDENVLLPEYLMLHFKKPSFDKYARFNSWGSATEFFTFQDMCETKICIPNIDEQKKVIRQYNTIRNHISILENINEKLEKLAIYNYESIFNNKNKNGKLNQICNYSDKRISINELTISTYFSTENMLKNKKGTIPAISMPEDGNVVFCEKGNTLISNIRPYFKKIYHCEFDCGCSTDVLSFKPISNDFSFYLYTILYSDHFFDYMTANSTGTKMPRGDKKAIMDYDIYVPEIHELLELNNQCKSIFNTININKNEITKLKSLIDFISL